jgi:hypothetical protein
MTAQGNRVTILEVFQSDGCTYAFKSTLQLIYGQYRRSTDGIIWTG